MTANPDNQWKEKYLNALDEQEKLEKSFAEEKDLWRRALVRVSLAADGQDAKLDELLAQMRDELRRQHSTLTTQFISQLDQVAINFEDSRTANALSIRAAISDTLKPLQQLTFDRSSKKNIEGYLSQLPERCKKIHLYPALLEQLAKIQQDALSNIEQPSSPGLLGKLLGKKSENQNEETKTNSNQNKPEKEENTSDFKEYAAPTPILQTVKIESDVSRESKATQTLSADFIQAIAQVLNGFLSSLENEIVIKNKAEKIRQEIEKGLAPDKVIPLLENLRNLVMEAYLASNTAFANYLNSVNQELSEIYSALGAASHNNQSQQSAGKALEASMVQGMQALETHAANATDLNLLKTQVRSQIDHIKQALDTYQQSTKAFSLGDQLAALSEKIKALEVESVTNKDNLESQRKKAMQDALTELPNRQAYNERAAAEVQRWKRYGRPLSIAVFDIDFFKKINDTYGHQAGDRVLKVIGRSVAKRLREVDFFCRFGGEEFVALLPETSADIAVSLLDKIRDAIAKASFNYKEQPMSITLSIGLTEFRRDDNLETAFERADQALYQAKHRGRNQTKML